MGNSSSSQHLSHHQQQHSSGSGSGSRSSRKQNRQTATGSLASFSTQLTKQQQQQPTTLRRRKSLELPDIGTQANQLRLPSIDSRDSSPFTTNTEQVPTTFATTVDYPFELLSHHQLSTPPATYRNCAPSATSSDHTTLSISNTSLDADSALLPTCSSAAVTETVAAATAVVQAAPALDIGAGPDGVPTLLTWKEPIKLRKPIIPEGSSNTSSQGDAFSALVALPPGPHQLKFIVDRRWKTSKYLPSATDDKGNLINYLQVNIGDQPFRGLGPRGIWSGYTYADWSSGGAGILEDHNGSSDDRTDSEHEWTSEIPIALLEYEEYHDRSDSSSVNSEREPPPPPSTDQEQDTPTPGHVGFAAEPPNLPAQLKEGILNLSSRLPNGASDDNSLLPKPDHSVLNHLAASPIRQGLLSVGVTSRFKRKYLTTVYYKPKRINE
ncbi:hypothetical protein H4Q26_004763 [Puccinia striiformis f. sp. tritici PST-130]|nr:hypothetical protein H4Q26_004763 [Puccinia striiformis f. sp. tritici PST-130]